MQKACKVSILVPVYNEQELISRTLESIIASQIDFPIEILIGNDCSTDDTLAVATKFKKKYPDIIRVISNEENLGNGRTFARLLHEAQGEYIHVLDADDYWTEPHKLKTQVDFLDQHPDYAIAAHNTDRIYTSTGEHFPTITTKAAKIIQSKVIDAKAVLSGEVYFHTSSLLYRNVYKGQVPAFLSHKLGGGDVIRLRIHSLYGKLKYFDEIWSVYNYTGKGIWSSLERGEQLRRQLIASYYWVTITPFSKKIFSWVNLSKIFFSYAKYNVSQKNTLKARAWKGIALVNLVFSLSITRSDIFKREVSKILRKVIDNFYPLHRKLVVTQKLISEGKFSSGATTLSQLCQMLAYPHFFRSLVFAGPVPAPEIARGAYELGQGLLPMEDTAFVRSKINKNKRDDYVILTSGLVSQGGGTLAEIESLLKLIPSEISIYVVSSCVAAPPQNKDIEIRLEKFRKGIVFYYADDNKLIVKIRQLHNILSEINAKRIFLYHSHHDISTLAALQDDVVDELYLAGHLDHGLNPGIGHPLITAYMYNRPWVASYYKEYINIPDSKLWNSVPFLADKTLPPRATFGELAQKTSVPIRSAVMAAQSYKLFSDYAYPYIDVLSNLMAEIPDMVHYYFGPLSDGELKRIHRMLAKKGVEKERFVHIPWFDLKQGLNHVYGINLYIQSWPIGGSRAALSAMSEGLPIIYHVHLYSSQFNCADYLYDEAPAWETPQQFIDILRQIDSDFLVKHSSLSFQYFKDHHTERSGLARYSQYPDHPNAPSEVDLDPFHFLNLTSLMRSRKLNIVFVLSCIFLEMRKYWRRVRK